MEPTLHIRGRGRGASLNGPSRPHSRNKHWSAGEANPRAVGIPGGRADGERWERGGFRGGGRGRGASRGVPRKFPNVSLRVQDDTKGKGRATENEDQVMQDEEYHEEETNTIDEPELETQEEREKFYQELVKAREAERKKAIAEGKMDDPMVPKRLEDAITMVGTCLDMCPRFERYRRERENNLFEWETIPGTKRVDHKRAVKMYERAAGDKTLPSDLRPPHVLKRTLDYLFHDLIPRGGFSATFNFIRDRSRSVRNDFTMQHNTGPLAIECHDRCARFHILALHFERDRSGFSPALEEQQLMNTLQSLKEFYDDQRGRYESPTELEMRVYHRLIHIRDQKERHEDIPDHITSHPVFKLTTDFRIHVQKKSAPITKSSALVVDNQAMQIFGQLAAVLRDQGNIIVIYLVACILERLFGKDAIDDIEALRGDLSVPDVIDGGPSITDVREVNDGVDVLADEEMMDELEGEYYEEAQPDTQPLDDTPAAAQQSTSQRFNVGFGSHPFTSTTSLPATPGSSTTAPAPPTSGSAFASLTTAPNPFGTPSIFGASAFNTSSGSVFGAKPEQPRPIFGAPSTTTAAPAAALKAPTPPPTASSAPPSTTAATTTNGGSYAPFGGATFKSAAPTPSLSAAPAVSISASAPPNGNAFGTFPQSSSSPAAAGWGAFAASAKPEMPSTQPTSAQEAHKPVLNPQAPTFTPFVKSSSNFNFSAPVKPNLPSTPPVTNGASNATAEPLSFTPPPSLSFTKSASPSATRASATPPLKIDTSSPRVKPPSVSSPANPPRLQRVQPISLPSTPTVDGSLPNLMIGHLKSSLEISSHSLSRTNTEILSPLILSSPSSSGFFVNNFTPKGTPSAKRTRTDSFPSLNLNGKGKPPVGDVSVVPQTKDEDLKAKALQFSQKNTVVKECFRLWKQRVTDKAAWLEACQHSESYRRKIQGERQSRTSTPDKKRRISTAGLPGASESAKKRPRKRPSEYQPPRTDEELARRLKENHVEHERRWAQGSFLQVIRSYVKGKLKASPKLPWSIWLSMNPDSDATAIWLERKFDVPVSGSWASDAVFSIPLTPASSAIMPGDPGLIVFECTPIEGLSDDIERKYRILDDCSRLRDIIKSLPSKRRFIPSLLIFCWTDGEKAYEGTDFIDMVKRLVNDSTIQSYHILPMTIAMKDPDGNLESCLPSLPFDVEGKLAQNLTVRGVSKKFEPTITSFVTEWIENCNFNGNFNWGMYCRVVQASLALLNKAGESSFELIGSPKAALLQKFDFLPVGNSDAVYDLVEEWLSSVSEAGDTEAISLDIESHRNINQEFPARTFIDHLLELLQLRLGRRIGKDLKTIYYVPVIDIKSAVEAFKESIQPLQLNLTQTLTLSVRRSPKRRGTSVDTDRLTPGPKRIRLDESTSSTTSSAYEERSSPSSPLANGRDTPSPSMSTISLATTATTEAPNISVAMLRALTKDLKRKYVTGT